MRVYIIFESLSFDTRTEEGCVGVINNCPTAYNIKIKYIKQYRRYHLTFKFLFNYAFKNEKINNDFDIIYLYYMVFEILKRF